MLRDAIEKEILKVYPGQTDPMHYAPTVKRATGGNEPLDGINIYDGGSCWHFVTFGLTELYEKECENMRISGCGYELTFKLKKEKYDDEQAELQNTFNNKNGFGDLSGTWMRYNRLS